MSDISQSEFRLVNGTLLLVFLGLMRHRKAKRVAEDMGLTQPAVSHALTRLRTLYGDPLFLRNSRGLEPTALAREIEPRIRRAVRTLGETLSEPAEFDPADSEITLRIAGFDYELAFLVPALIARTEQVGRGISIHSQTLASGEALEALVQGRIDLAIGFFETLPGRGPHEPFISEDLYIEDYVVTGRAGHPLFRHAFDAQTYADAKHVLVTPSGVVRGLVDYSLDALGLHRNVHATVPLFFPALTLLEQSDMIATLPRQVAETFASRFNLEFATLPFPGPTFSVRAVRHRRDSDSPVHGWLINLLRSLHG
ncbi:MAG: LysR family transcriptional regulator [Paracoccaceae bacterium]|nr:LysR family transcriptional regulator [Paracoccaceae bacterium]